MSYIVLLEDDLPYYCTPRQAPSLEALQLYPELLKKLVQRQQQQPGYHRTWRTQTSRRDTGSTLTAGKDEFKVCLDVQQFKPEEISVRTVDDNNIVIEGKHDEREDEHGFISRHFVRRYVIPPGHDAKNVQSSLSSDGVLTVTVPKVVKETNERIIPITHTGPVRTVTAAESSEQQQKEEKKEEAAQK